MGLLDMLSGMTPEQNEGLLGLAANMLQAGGPQRMPVSLGQALGSGLQGFSQGKNDAERLKQERQFAAQQSQLMGYKLRDAESDFQNQEQARSDTRAAHEWLRRYGGGGAAAPAGTSPGAGQTVSHGAVAAGGGTGGGNSALFAQRMAQAQAMRTSGNPILMAQAKELEEATLKFQPKVSGWKEVKQGGQVLYAPFFEDGSNGQPVPLEVAKQLEKVNTGGTTELVDSYTGKTVRSLQNTATADAKLQAATAGARLAFDRSQASINASAPQYMETNEGIVALPKRLTPGQAPIGTLVTGPSGNPLEKKKPPPPRYVVEGVTVNAKSLASINSAIASLEGDGKNSVGARGYLPNFLLNRVDPAGTATRADIADVGSLKIHDRSGAAVTASESPRLMPFIPLVTDDAPTAVKKLKRLKKELESETNNLTFQFPEARKLAEHAAEQAAPADGGGNVVDFGSLK